MSIEDRWKGARTGPGKRYEVRWRESGVARKRRFSTKPAALEFEAKLRVDPESTVRRPPLTVQQMMDAWFATVSVRPTTVAAYRLEVGEIVKEFGDRQASSVKPSEVRAWVARPHPGASIRRRSLITLRRAYKLALADKAVTEDPTEGARLPKAPRTNPQFLTWEALGHLASCAGTDAPLVWLLGTTGLRLGEAIALDQDDVDRMRCRLRVRRSKTQKGVRSIPLDPEVLALLPTEPGPLFRSPEGHRLNANNWRVRRFRGIVRDAGLSPEFTPHKLRHTAASLAIASGADVGVVQEMLGHASAAMTLDLYRHLFDSALDTAAARMAEARRAAAVQIQPAALEAGEQLSA